MPKLNVVYPTTNANKIENIKQNNRRGLPNVYIKKPKIFVFNKIYKVINRVSNASSEAKNIITFLDSHTKGLNKLVATTTGLFTIMLSNDGFISDIRNAPLLLTSSISWMPWYDF